MEEHAHVYFTPAGYSLFLQRLEHARAAYRAVCDDNPAARESGDSSVWHDNFAFEENQRQMHQLARRIRDLEGVLQHAEIAATPPPSPQRVVLGARVRYFVDGAAGSAMCLIVGHGEGDPASRAVAYDSPLGRALLGAKVGDEVEAVLGGRVRLIEIEAIDGSHSPVAFQEQA